MNGLRFVFALLAILPITASAHEPSTAPRHARNEVALVVGILSGGRVVRAAHRYTPLSVGAGVWGAWEPPLGTASDERRGSYIGAMWGVQGRVVLGG